MKSYHQNSMNSSSINNSKEILLWTSRNSTTTSIFVSIRQLNSKKTLFLVTSPSKYTLILQNTLSHIVITLPILVNVHIYTSLVHSLLVSMTNYICVKCSMKPQSYKIVSTHSHEISGWKFYPDFFFNMPSIF